MIVQVSSEVRINGDGRGWVVERRMPPTEKRGEAHWEALGYHGWISIAARSILERHLPLLDGKSDELGLADLIDVICQATVQIEDACERLAKQVGCGGKLDGEEVVVVRPSTMEELGEHIEEQTLKKPDPLALKPEVEQ